MFLIYKFEKDFDLDGNEVLSSRSLPHKYVSKTQAELKIKTLDDNFVYKIEEELENRFYLYTFPDVNEFYNPIENATIMVDVDSVKGYVFISNEEIGYFKNKEELLNILEKTGLTTDGIVTKLKDCFNDN